MPFTPSAATIAKGEKLAASRKQVSDIFDAHRKDDGYDMPAEKVAEVRALNAVITDEAKAYEDGLELDRIAFEAKAGLDASNRVTRPMAPDSLSTPGDPPVKARTMREVFATQAEGIKSLAEGGHGQLRFDLTPAESKTLMTLSDIAPQADRQAVVPSAQYLSDVTPIFTPGTTDVNSIEFYEETTFTNAAAETAEGNAAPESALSFTLRTYPVQEISTFIPITRRALDDNSGLASYVEGRLGLMLALRRSQQLLTGNGTTPNLRGILNVSGIQTQAKGADPTPDAVFKAMTLVRTTGDAEPTGAVFHAQDWQDVKLLRTVDGVYIWGSPSDVGPDRIWGLDVRVSNSITQNTALVGAFRPYAQVFERQGVTIELSSEHSTFFTERKVAILIYQRLALAVYRPAAFCQVTGV